MQDIYIGRQPIFDRDLEVYAYELLFRSGSLNQAADANAPFDGDRATSQVIVNAFIEIGLDQIVGNRRAFINLTRSFVTAATPLPFPQDRVVLEILEDIEPDAEVLAGLRTLAGQGYQMALDDFVFQEDRQALLEVAHIVKIDLMAVPRETLQAEVARLRRHDVRLIAEKVETHEDFEQCRELGFDYFQGYFLSRPNIVQGRQLPPNRLAVLQLLARLQDPQADAGDIERLVAQDVALSYKLLRYINSAFFALPKKIESIRQAVIYLGTRAIRTWVSLLVVAGLDDKPAALVAQAMQRARMCELLAQRARRPQPDAYFTVGLFSLLEALLDAPLESILDTLPFSDGIRDALLRQEGPYGEALACVIAYERGHFLKARFDRLGATEMTDTYLAATHWADQSASAAAG
jgi:EAL and modified HD-GYP domain-containing signal transduction protein